MRWLNNNYNAINVNKLMWISLTAWEVQKQVKKSALQNNERQHLFVLHYSFTLLFIISFTQILLKYPYR